jgi:predicted AAA+ superfamily ATPase
LTDALMVRQLQPWHANLGKRQVKSPKIYIRDTGLLHQLLGIGTSKDLLTHPRLGASWEGMVIEQVLATTPHDEAWFWAAHQGAEIDLLLRRGDRFFGIECKRADAPKLTPSIRIALEDLGLERVAAIYPERSAIDCPIASRLFPWLRSSIHQYYEISKVRETGPPG